MAKTAGTSLNGELAARYERVCGHKGYSYDAFQVNKRRNSSQGNKVVDGLSKLNKGYSRSRVSPSVMSEIGYEDCDYISHETGWSFWPHTFQKWFFPMELHVPCREPISHLMSMCNQRNMTFDCTKDIVGQSKRCLVEMGRFSSRLVNTYSNIHTKCFAAQEIPKYLDYMDHKLQRRNIPTDYIFWATNKPRSPDNECIWHNSSAQEIAKSWLLELDYYKFCDSCIGSQEDLLRSAHA